MSSTAVSATSPRSPSITSSFSLDINQDPFEVIGIALVWVGALGFALCRVCLTSNTQRDVANASINKSGLNGVILALILLAIAPVFFSMDLFQTQHTITQTAMRLLPYILFSSTLGFLMMFLSSRYENIVYLDVHPKYDVYLNLFMLPLFAYAVITLWRPKEENWSNVKMALVGLCAMMAVFFTYLMFDVLMVFTMPRAAPATRAAS